MALIAVIDVDLTVFPSDKHWWDWMFVKMGYMPEDFPNTTHRLLDYNLANEVRDMGYTEITKINSLDFWRQENVYDDMEPLEGSVEALRALHEQGWEIVFVSALKGNHHKSKYNALKKHFPFMDGLVGTKEKQYVRCDLAVDDRLSYLNKYAHLNASDRFLFSTPYKQDGYVSTGHYLLPDWSRFLEILEINEEGEFC